MFDLRGVSPVADCSGKLLFLDPNRIFRLGSAQTMHPLTKSGTERGREQGPVFGALFKFLNFLRVFRYNSKSRYFMINKWQNQSLLIIHADMTKCHKKKATIKPMVLFACF